jgi:hypothetical protein
MREVEMIFVVILLVLLGFHPDKRRTDEGSDEERTARNRGAKPRT